MAIWNSWMMKRPNGSRRSRKSTPACKPRAGQSRSAGFPVMFSDAGFFPILSGNSIKLGPGQMAAVGFGRYAAPEFDLGVQEDVRIPRTISPIAATFSDKSANTIEATIEPPAKGDLRIIFQQRGKDGGILRSW